MENEENESAEKTDLEKLQEQTANLTKALQAEREEKRKLIEAEANRKKVEEESALEHKALAEKLKIERDELNGKLTQYEAREKARLEKLTASNAARLQALPEHLRALVPEGLDPEAAALQIEKLAALSKDERPVGARGTGGGKPAPSSEAETLAKQLNEPIEIAQAILEKRKKKTP